MSYFDDYDPGQEALLDNLTQADSDEYDHTVSKNRNAIFGKKALSLDDAIFLLAKNTIGGYITGANDIAHTEMLEKLECNIMVGDLKLDFENNGEPYFKRETIISWAIEEKILSKDKFSKYRSKANKEQETSVPRKESKRERRKKFIEQYMREEGNKDFPAGLTRGEAWAKLVEYESTLARDIVKDGVSLFKPKGCNTTVKDTFRFSGLSFSQGRRCGQK